MMSKVQQAQGFWSYAHNDDAAMHGAIRRLAENVKAEYGVLTGGTDLKLFFDRASLKWGDEWRERIRQALEETTFFIPIITPRYFKSEECRDELLSFHEGAGELGLRGLILPLYFADVSELEDGVSSDPAVGLVAEYQYEDWRNLRLFEETVQPYLLAVNRLTTHLLEVAGPSEELRRKEEGPQDKKKSSSLPDNGQPEGGDIGEVELLADGEEAFPRIVETLNDIVPEIAIVGEITSSASEEIKQSDAMGKGFRGRLLVLNRLAQKLTSPADVLEDLTMRYAADLLVLDPAIKKLIQRAAEQSQEDPEAVEEFFTNITGMVDKSAEATESIELMIQAMEGNLNFSRELRKPLLRMRISLQSMVDGQHLIESWRDALEGLDD